MEFVATNKYAKGNLNQAIDFDSLKNMDRVRVSQKLELLPGEENLALIKKYAEIGLKVVPIKRCSDKDWSQRKDFPNRVLLETTSRCNYACRMCPTRQLKRPRIDLDKKTCFKVLDELSECGVEGVWLFNLGEPLMHPDWREIVKYAGKKNNLGMIWFSSNGFALNNEYADFILNSKITFMSFSLHSTNAKTYGYVAPEKNYAQVRNNFDYLMNKKKELGHGPIIDIQMVDQKGTHDDINAFLEMFYQTGEIVSVNALEYANLPNNLGGSKRERPALTKCNRLSRGDGFVVSTGNLQPCDAVLSHEISLGNVKDNSIYDLWNSKKRLDMIALNDMGELYKSEHCRECTDYDL